MVKRVFNEYYLETYLLCELRNANNFHSLEAVDRVSDPQLPVNENSN